MLDSKRWASLLERDGPGLGWEFFDGDGRRLLDHGGFDAPHREFTRGTRPGADIIALDVHNRRSARAKNPVNGSLAA